MNAVDQMSTNPDGGSIYGTNARPNGLLLL